jgi:diaminohydroxyphosphoribosylaminopyrimidine deaminase/5-amino-6-(5-phosphoribosylamino)uracil reductase
MDDAFFMRRCLQLASHGLGTTSPNPLVGSVIVHPERGIIGEGWHHQAGGPHAEVKAIQSVADHDWLAESTLYVNLEPCSHHGKTPPCADLIVKMGIRKVVVGMEDPNPLVAGQGLRRLKDAGVNVKVNVDVNECKSLNKRFLAYVLKNRPYIILKWAQSADGRMDPRMDPPAGDGGIPVSSPETQKWVHLWRSEEPALLTGSGTILVDQPQLNVRKVFGSSPEVFVLDRRRRAVGRHSFVSLTGTLEEALETIHSKGHNSVLVEAGPTLLAAFLESGLADEVRIIRAPQPLGKGRPAPVVEWPISHSMNCGGDQITWHLKP